MPPNENAGGTAGAAAVVDAKAAPVVAAAVAGAQEGAGAANTGAAGAQGAGNAAGAQDGAQAAAVTPPAGGDWPATWRETYAGEDKAKLAALGRYATPKDALDAMFTGREALSKAMSQLPPGKDATPEQVKAYRTAQGVPEKPDGYFDKLDKGIVFGEADKPVIMNYLTKAHERGDAPAVVAENLKIYHDAAAAAVQMMNKTDADARKSFDNQMRESLGKEYDDNMGRFETLLDTVFPKELKQALMNARLGDEKATPLMLSPGFVRSMITIAREINPSTTALPGVGQDNLGSIESQIKEYETGDGSKVPMIGSKKWHKDQAAQENYRALIDMRDKFKKKA